MFVSDVRLVHSATKKKGVICYDLPDESDLREYEACEFSDCKMLILILMGVNLFDISKRLPTAFDNICKRDA